MSRLGPSLPALLTISRKGQITLPWAALDVLGVKPGDRLSVTTRHGALEVRRIGPSVVEQTAGSLAQYVRRSGRKDAP